MARTVYELQQHRELLCQQITGNLDILIGSITTKGPNNPGHNLNSWVNGAGRTRHIRIRDLEKVRLMLQRHKKLKVLIKELADLNWKILLLQSE